VIEIRAMPLDADIFAPGFKETPYWWEAAPRPERAPAPVPAKTDVAIVGSGYTGLSAALHLARGGREVTVFEAGEPGYGASSRNAGYVGRTLKHSLGSLIDSVGTERAKAYYREARLAYDHVRELIEREKIECHLARCGRFMAALTPTHYEAMARDMELKRRHLGDESEMIPAGATRRELGSDLYQGGALIPDMSSVHPGLYQLGLLALAEAAGASLLAHTQVIGLRRDGAGFLVETPRGRTLAREVVVATNGYTGRESPRLRRRLVPFHAFMIATEALPKPLIDKLIPGSRTCHDYNNNLFYFRRAPDSDRILLGGRTGNPARDLRARARVLQRALGRILPDLKDAKLSHVWTGQCAATFDEWPHIGQQDGMHYAMGYCFAGLPMGTWFGQKIARRILGTQEGGTAFDDLPFQTKPYYWGWPWFRPLVVAQLDWQDWRGR
jgi:glycine/D-amino acid oxidase-like deaminating enzyme